MAIVKRPASTGRMSKDEYLSFLGSVSKEISSDPFQPRTGSDGHPTSENLRIILDELGIDDGQLDNEDRVDLHSYLFEQRYRTVMKGAKLQVIRSDLGTRGLLPARDYHLSFGDFGKHETEFESKRSLTDAISHPDAYEHYVADVKTRNHPTLFLKDRGKYLLLILTRREGLRIDVLQSYRVFRDAVQISDDRSPRAVLKDFIGVYGRDFEVNGETRRLVIGESFSTRERGFMDVTGKGAGNFEVVMLKLDLPDQGQILVSYGFLINSGLYLEHVERHRSR